MSAAWLLRTALRRMRDDARLLLVALVLAVTATTAITALVLLVVVAEPAGLRATFAAASADRVDVSVDVERPAVPVAVVTDAATSAVGQDVLGGLDATASTIALTGFARVPALDRDTPAIAYLGQYDGIADHAVLVSGTLPDAGTASSGVAAAGIDVAVPEAAASSLGIAVGDRLTVNPSGGQPVVVRVVGVFRAIDPGGDYWARDLLTGAGDVPGFPQPGTTVYVPTHAFGPLVAAPGALDAAAVPVQRIDLRFHPSFARVTAADLPVLGDRVSELSQAVTRGLGNIADSVSASSDLGDIVARASANLVVTRSTVVVVALLLLVVALVALAQTALLLTGSRTTQQRLFRARGGSTRQLLGMAVIEGLILAAVTVALSPVLAGTVYAVVAARPGMVAAGMPQGAVVPASAWLAATVVAVAFVVVLAAPVLRADPEADRSSRGRPGGLVRLGIDLAVVVLAAVAFVRLLSYRSPVDPQAAFAIDPVLVAAPALVLVAGALVATHLLPLVARPIDASASRSRRAVLPLATWEVARRTRRASAAVLLLTLALGASSFGATFLATWRQAQVDQVALALGAPVVVSADATHAAAQRAALAGGAVGGPNPIIRRSGLLAPAGADLSGGDSSSVASVSVLGLPEDALPLIRRGRLGTEGGNEVAAGLASTRSVPVQGIDLGMSARGLAATARVGDPADPVPGATARLYAVLEDETGLVSTLDLGSAGVDGRAVDLRAVLPGSTTMSGSRMVGLQVDVFASDPNSFRPGSRPPVDVLMGDVAALTGTGDAADLTARPLDLAPANGWTASSNVAFGSQPTSGDPPAGAQVRLTVALPDDLASEPASYVLVGWPSVAGIPAVMTTSLVESLDLSNGTPLSLVIAGSRVPVALTGSAPLVPGAVSDGLRAGTDAGATGSDDDPGGSVVVVDQAALSRALVQAGRHGNEVDEWWIDVPEGTGEAYAAGHPSPSGQQPTLSAEGLARQLQSGPLRIPAQTALLLLVGASAVLAAIGFAVHTTVTVRARRLEFAQLRAIGLTRRALTGVVAAEALVVGLLGVVFGIGLGVVLSLMTGPVVAVSPSGAPAVPTVMVVIPWLQVGAIAVGLVTVLAVVVAIVGLAQRSAELSRVIRGAAE